MSHDRFERGYWWLAVALLTTLLTLVGCKIPTDFTVRADDLPWCPNDSVTWVSADSVPLGCVRPF